ncbi:unnamed protein product [Caenorhabditis brenneri]
MVPIHGLPKNALKTVLNQMDIMSLIFFSLCSKRTKLLVVKSRSAKLYMSVELTSNPTISIKISSRYGNSLLNTKFLLTRISHFTELDQIVPCTMGPATSNWFDIRKDGYGPKQWLQHFQSISESCTLKLEDFNDWKFSIESVQRTLSVLRPRSVKICGAISEVYQTTKYFPIGDNVQLETRGGRAGETLSKIMIQNVFKVCLISTLDLNTLLLSNCCYLNARGNQLSSKDLNIFIKSWMNGTHSRLQCLELIKNERRLQSMDFEAIFKGIRYIERPANQQRMFKMYHSGGWSGFYFNGGFDIQNVHGVDATVLMDRRGRKFKMYICNNGEMEER